MKSLRITLGVAAIALGTFTAFSFAPANTVNEDETGIFYVNPDGSMGDAYNPQLHPCDPGPQTCAREYDLETELPTGQNVIQGVKRQ
ncbi:hypothetical protein EG339_20995 [Chryseobacterium bernardetii]|uniref:Uncharacterized protein n=2 Tax=Chryseobacterium TaxID=59732 RepID=A0A3G6TG66_9FLAO|nr:MULTISPECIES: hypothetical protein [Chryseobacterium]AZB26883.1 hypothetical protein EG339_20995 [Chryseobacterium bernardetii]MCS3531173.1 hypothetical protein [Chryseobacterium sp. JUb7]